MPPVNGALPRLKARTPLMASGSVGYRAVVEPPAVLRNSSRRRRVFRGMELLDAVRSALPPDATPLMIGAMLLVILSLGREVEPRKRRS